VNPRVYPRQHRGSARGFKNEFIGKTTIIKYTRIRGSSVDSSSVHLFTSGVRSSPPNAREGVGRWLLDDEDATQAEWSNWKKWAAIASLK
jgi:hypothetical protein